MRWNFQKTEDWEHLLPGEPSELRVKAQLSDDQEAQTREEEILEEKHLDLPPSWVHQLHIGIPGIYALCHQHSCYSRPYLTYG